MASNGQGLRTGLQVLLGILIVGLAYWLYVSITEPYKVIERQRELTEVTRTRMDHIRKALVRYEVVHGRYTSSLDTLVHFVKEDSILAYRADSVFGAGFQPDSLPYSPRTGRRFELAVNDTARVATYLLRDPDSNDQIGSLVPDVTMINAASWE
jgi:hypothetical protein